MSLQVTSHNVKCHQYHTILNHYLENPQKMTAKSPEQQKRRQHHGGIIITSIPIHSYQRLLEVMDKAMTFSRSR
jgi:hypothetical protein